jgi:hypothetical protein
VADFMSEPKQLSHPSDGSEPQQESHPSSVSEPLIPSQPNDESVHLPEGLDLEA